ncbi:MAG: Sec-independent protein translocase protein TatB [Sulfuricaulis sp.]|nr:Sec-independent protein translocase protein TatB [Sulfuricaulis sp.]
MFDIGFSELVAVGLIALIVLGPKRLPEVARTAGRWMGQLRRFITDVKQDIDREVRSEDLAELRKLKEELNDTRQMMQNTSGELVKGFTEINPEYSSPTIRSSEAPALTDGSAASSKVARRRGGSRGQARAGKKHGKSRKTRRR